MTSWTADRIDTEFPPSPVAGTAFLRPLRSWREVYEENKVTETEFDAFWYQSVIDGIAYFYSWLGEPRATVLVVRDNAGGLFVECRTVGDRHLSSDESAPIVEHVTKAYSTIGTRGTPNEANQ